MKLVNLDFPSADAALVSKDIDAAFGYVGLFKLRDQGLAKVVWSAAEDSYKYTRQTALLVADDFAARHPQVVHQAMVVFNSDGYNAKGSKGGNRSFVSLNDDGTTIWEQGVDTIPGTFSVLGRIGTVEVIPA